MSASFFGEIPEYPEILRFLATGGEMVKAAVLLAVLLPGLSGCTAQEWERALARPPPPCFLTEEERARTYPGCVWGFASAWTFDLATRVATLDKVVPREVCRYQWHHPHANLCFVLRKADEVVLTNAMSWSLARFYDYMEHGRMTGKVITNAGMTHHIAAFPIALESVNNYQVWDLTLTTLVGAGPIVEPEGDEGTATAPVPQ